MPKIRIGDIYPRSRALGPGLRFCIWVQGCNRKCLGCASPELQSSSLGYLMETQALAEQVISTPRIDGISISGGEPMNQASALVDSLRTIKSVRPELNTIVFTGYALEELKGYDQIELLQYIDLLIDGPYIESLNDGVGLRGSSNQKMFFLTEALSEYKDTLLRGERIREVHLNGDSLITIGIGSCK